MVIKAFLRNERLRVGGSLNFDFRNTFENGSIEMAVSVDARGFLSRGIRHTKLRPLLDTDSEQYTPLT